MKRTPEVSESPTRTVVRVLTAEGKSPRDIARILDISTQAVHKHLKKIQAAKESAA